MHLLGFEPQSVHMLCTLAAMQLRPKQKMVNTNCKLPKDLSDDAKMSLSPVADVPTNNISASSEDMNDVVNEPKSALSLDDLQNRCKLGYQSDPYFLVAENTAKLTSTADGLSLMNGKLVVPNVEKLRREILSEIHDTPFEGHPGGQRTYELLQRMF